jgi:hypothetical protein
LAHTVAKDPAYTCACAVDVAKRPIIRLIPIIKVMKFALLQRIDIEGIENEWWRSRTSVISTSLPFPPFFGTWIIDCKQPHITPGKGVGTEASIANFGVAFSLRGEIFAHVRHLDA